MMENKFTVSPLSENCLSYWYPSISGIVPTPKTFFVRISDGFSLIKILDGHECWYFDSLCSLLKDAIRIIGLPCFLRTGHGSGKHNWENCCYVDDINQIGQRVFNLVEWSNCVDMIGLPHDVWVVRKMLPTRPLFRCKAYGNMPVVREWRYFIDGPELLYGIPYWPESALRQGRPDIKNWEQHIPTLHEKPGSDVEKIAVKVGERIKGRWSVDVLECRGEWYVTDMAAAESSYGWAG